MNAGVKIMDIGSRKVFCIGLSRTGTTSLHLAMIMLGLTSAHYPSQVAMKWLEGDFSPETTASYQSFSDVPSAIFFKQLHRTHPDALFIYTYRDLDPWLKSVEKWFNSRPKSSQYTVLRDYIRAATYGTIMYSRARFADRYLEHDQIVREYFADKQEIFLPLRTEDMSWGTIAKFLGRDVPKAKFPHLNTPLIGQLAQVDKSRLLAAQSKLTEMFGE